MALRYIQQYFERSGRVMTDNNKKQALVFKGATVLPNRKGMAPGMAVEKEVYTIFYYQDLHMRWNLCLRMKRFPIC